MAHGILLLDSPGLHHPALPTLRHPTLHTKVSASFSDSASHAFKARTHVRVGHLLTGAVPPNERASWGSAVFAVLRVATGTYSFPGAWPGLGSEGWHGWRCEYLRGHTQRHMAPCCRDLPQFSRSQGSSTWACELFTLTLCPLSLTPYTLHALVPSKRQLFVPLPGMPSPTCPSG